MTRLLLRLLLPALLLAGAAAHTDELDRWDFWPPLPDPPSFTGRYLASAPGGIHLRPQSFTPFDLFAGADAERHANKLLYGSVLLARTSPAHPESDPGVRAALERALAALRRTPGVYVSPDVALVDAAVYALRATGDNGESETVVLHAYRDLQGDVRRFKSHVTFGDNYALTLEDARANVRHRVVVGLDREGEHTLFQHTFAPLDADSCSSGSCSAAGYTVAAPRILSYNVWNTNPSADVYGFAKRWPQYAKRMDHLARFVREARADIVGFQEVRYDSELGGAGEHAQVQHLARRLPGYQFVYQPAMGYLNKNQPYERIEEGPAVFSKHPIVHSDYLLLSRDPNDPNDAHQRLCLHAVVDVPGWGRVDVYVAHLSLSERAREQSMVEIWRFMRAGQGVTQVLLGDLNAEPHSRGLRFLRGEAALLGETTDLTDAFLATNTEAAPRSADPGDRHARFTFPSDNPAKRIDFVLYRGKGRARACDMVGQTPTDDTRAFPQDVGMLNFRSPVYASDHRGVVAEFVA
ncbi:hypothetical protein PybrP1_005419 [[Pythium] brassicae (nom. inval.)]|nr:hypothetical protein PybrP1_005419 [[Pythium] brassicae (nom. inval.)]